MRKVLKFLKDEEGAISIEYILIAAFIALGIIIGVQFLGGSMNNKINQTGQSVSNLTVP